MDCQNVIYDCPINTFTNSSTGRCHSITTVDDPNCHTLTWLPIYNQNEYTITSTTTANTFLDAIELLVAQPANQYGRITRVNNTYQVELLSKQSVPNQVKLTNAGTTNYFCWTKNPQFETQSGSLQDLRATYVGSLLWEVGQTIPIGFIYDRNSTDANYNAYIEMAIERVKNDVAIIANHVNLNLTFTDNVNQALIKISFDPSLGSWSQIGTNAINTTGATMNIGWFDGNVVIHEFGHALGLLHEHQNPRANFCWNREAVINDILANNPGWTVADVEYNIFMDPQTVYPSIRSSLYDDNSVMKYPIQSGWIQTGGDCTYGSADPASGLSPTDRMYLQKMYPHDNVVDCTVTEWSDWSPTLPNGQQIRVRHLIDLGLDQPCTNLVETRTGQNPIEMLFSINYLAGASKVKMLLNTNNNFIISTTPIDMSTVAQVVAYESDHNGGWCREKMAVSTNPSDLEKLYTWCVDHDQKDICRQLCDQYTCQQTTVKGYSDRGTLLFGLSVMIIVLTFIAPRKYTHLLLIVVGILVIAAMAYSVIPINHSVNEYNQSAADYPQNPTW